MLKQTLFLMLGYPGSGKTTASKLIHQQTGAVHIWADHERRQLYNIPTYSHEENTKLYNQLNKLTDQLLSSGKSVIYDTNFNFFRDRELLRNIARSHGTQTIVIWIKTPAGVARRRATQDAHKHHTRVLGNMPHSQFERIAQNLQPPHKNEHVIELNGDNITPDMLTRELQNINNL